MNQSCCDRKKAQKVIESILYIDDHIDSHIDNCCSNLDWDVVVADIFHCINQYLQMNITTKWGIWSGTTNYPYIVLVLLSVSHFVNIVEWKETILRIEK